MMGSDTFLRAVDGARGTVVFGNGVSALDVEIDSVGDDYLTAINADGLTVMIPLSGIAYFRFADEI